MSGLKFLKLDANHCSLLLGTAVIFGLSKEWIVAILIVPPLIRMIVEFAKYRPPVQHHVSTPNVPQRTSVEADYTGPKLIQQGR